MLIFLIARYIVVGRHFCQDLYLYSLFHASFRMCNNAVITISCTLKQISIIILKLSRTSLINQSSIKIRFNKSNLQNIPQTHFNIKQNKVQKFLKSYHKLMFNSLTKHILFMVYLLTSPTKTSPDFRAQSECSLYSIIIFS